MRTPLVLALIAALPAGTGLLRAQVAPAVSDSPSASSTDDQVLTLDPFTVTTEHEGYQAVDTLGGARVRTKLVDTPSSLSVVTKKLLQDLGITNAQDLLIYTADTDVAGVNGTFSGISSRGFGVAQAGESQRLANPPSVNRARGLAAMDNTRNYFISEIPWDSFNISRVDISRGPNSFLFGVGSPSGISNVSTNEAIYKDEGSVEAHYGSFGTTRETFDFNKVILPDELALRVDLVNDNTQYEQDPAFNHTKRAYGAVRYDPKFLSTESSHFKIQGNFESGRGDSNNPRVMPPQDFITGYYSGVSKTGYNPFTFNPQTVGGSGANYFDPTVGPWVNNGDIHYAWGNSPTFYFDSQGNLLQATQAGVGGTTAANYRPGGFSGVNNVYHLYTNGFAQYAINQNALNPNLFPGANAGTVNYLNKTLGDPSIFDFYKKLIDGPNKREWQNWNTFNVNVQENLFHDHLALQAIVDHETYNRGQEGLLLGNMSPYISVNLDANTLTIPTWLPGASANPYVGQPFIANDTGGGGSSAGFINDNYQVTAAGNFNFEELMPHNPLAKILGHHELTALGGIYRTKEDDRNWQLYGADPLTWGVPTHNGTQLNQNTVSWVTFLGPSLANTSSPAGLHLNNLANPMIPTSGPVTTWNGTWTAAASVNPSDPWVDPMPNGASNMTQKDNPANYAGYQPMSVNILNSRNNVSQLYSSGSKTEQKLTSGAVMYQGYFWNDSIIPEFGIRSDKVLQRGNQAYINPSTTIASMNYGLTDPGVTVTTRSTSYGLTVHVPKLIGVKLPAGTDVSLYYFHGNNETPKVRYSIDGSPLANETGKTDDYAVRIDTLNGHASLKVSAFKTIDNNAAASYGQPLGASGWLIDSLPSWTLTFAALGEIGAHVPTSQMPADVASSQWIWGWGQSNPAAADAAGQAVQKYFPTMFPQSFWDQYGMNVDMAAVQRGDWVHILKGGVSPFPWTVTGNNHMIHGVFPTIDQNIESKGYEIEATIRPVLNWDLTFNASKLSAWQTALGADASTYLNNMANIWLNTPVGMTAEWGYYNPAGSMKQQFLSGLWAPYLTQVALTGTAQPELSKWQFRGVTNYSFDTGAIKGLNIGGAIRWQSAAILGYGIKQATILGNAAWINDVNQPLYGRVDYHFDTWIGYHHKLTSKIDWKLQLNVRNVGERPHLTPVSVEPDGTYAQQRIEEGQVFDVSAKFTF